MTNTEITTSEPKRVAPMVQLRNFLDQRINEIKTALPAHISPERFIRVVITAAQINPEILACDRQSLWNACMRAANDGLLPDGVEGAIVPFKSKATWIPMYGGLLKKFRNSGEFKWVTAGLVYENDEYDHWIDETGEHFKHRPADDNTGKKIRRVYALATTKDGGSFIADMSVSEVDKRRKMSRAQREDAPWKVWPEEMMKKTALRQLSKLLPKSSDLDSLMRRDEEALYGVDSIEERRQTITARPADTVGMLDAFGAEASNAGERQEAEVSNGGTVGQPDQNAPSAVSAARGSESRPADQSTEFPAAPTDLSAGELKAFERGKSDRAKGIGRKAVPGDLRENSKLAIAWVRGWEAAERFEN
jgi:recombination protein RecT